MEFANQLVKATFLKRYKRFFADIQFSNKIQDVAHVANTGSLKSCLAANADCLVSASTNPERKLKWNLEALKAEDGTWIGVNTSRPNQLVKEAFNNKVIESWKDFETIKPEVKINKETRLDFLLESASKTKNQEVKRRYVEVKNVTLKEGEYALFPDAVTERGQKHLQELMKLLKVGFEAEIVFVIQRTDCKKFKVAEMIDPEYAKLLRQASAMGVLISAYQVRLNQHKIELLATPVQVEL